MEHIWSEYFQFIIPPYYSEFEQKFGACDKLEQLLTVCSRSRPLAEYLQFTESGVRQILQDASRTVRKLLTPLFSGVG